jgi:hypothetical protein
MDTDTEDTVQTHLGFSTSLYTLDERGRWILSQLRRKRHVVVGKDTIRSIVFDDPAANHLYRALLKLLNTASCLPRLYNDVLNALDKSFFARAPDARWFTVGGVTHPVTRIYFDQSAWITPEFQKAEFDPSSARIELGECMIVICYLKEYAGAMTGIKTYLLEEAGDAACARPTEVVCARIGDLVAFLSRVVDDRLRTGTFE